ncbi:MAG TPA: hypothetical protein VFC63_21165 [Blastocatellia bacterium]|nr:hypothetical protein [Blastocatellia bacterium]
MPRSKESLKIDINEATNDGQRIITVAITAPVQEFVLPDLLAERKAITPLTESLKQSVKEVTESYLSGAEELIAGLAANRNGNHIGSKQEISGAKPASNGNSKGVKSGSNRNGNDNSKRESAADKLPVSSVIESPKLNQTSSVPAS